jgi:hypothetical protein
MDRTNERPPSSLPVAPNGPGSINGATPLAEASQVGTYPQRPASYPDASGGGPSGGLNYGPGK